MSPPDPPSPFNQHIFTQFGGSGQDTPTAITSDAEGNIYVAGTTTSPDLPTTRNAAQPESMEAIAMRSTDRGVTWQKVTSPIPSHELAFLAAHPVIPDLVFAGARESVYRSTDGARTWQKVFTATAVSISRAGQVGALGFDPINPQRIYLYSSSGLSISGDLGNSWLTKNTLNYSGGTAVDHPPASVLVDPSGSNAIIVNDRSARLSRDGGQTWGLLLPPIGGASLIVAAFDPFQPGKIFLGRSAGNLGSLWLSSDWGKSFTELYVLASSAVTQILADPITPGLVYALRGSSSMKTENGGLSWRFIPNANFSDDPHFLFGCDTQPIIVTRRGDSIGVSADHLDTVTALSLRGVYGLSGGAGCSMYVTKQPNSDAFLAKWNRHGELLWSTYVSTLDQDSADQLALDHQGNAILLWSSNVSNPKRILAKYGASGKLVWQTPVESSFSVDLAIDPQDNVLIVGGRPQGEDLPPPGNGLATKIGSTGDLLWAIPLPQQPLSVAAEPSGSFLIADLSSQLTRLSESGSVMLTVNTAVSRPSLVRTDKQGNVYVAGIIQPIEPSSIPSAYISSIRAGFCPPLVGNSNLRQIVADIQIAKLRPGSLEPVYSSIVGGECGSTPVTLSVGNDGQATVAFRTQARAFDLLGTLAAYGFCPGFDWGVGVFQLHPDGTRLLRSTMLDSCPSVAATAVESDIYAVSGTSADVTIFQIPTNLPPGPRIDRIANAFSGRAVGVAPNELLSIYGDQLGPINTIDLGINSPRDLPLELGGVRVLLNNQPVPIFKVASNHLIVVTPSELNSQTVTIVVEYQGQRSNDVVTPVVPYDLALLTLGFPQTDPGQTLEAFAQNADGTLNGPNNPAPAGSQITLFATGLGRTTTPVIPGSIAATDLIAPTLPLYDNSYRRVAGIRSMLGFLSSIFAVPYRVPTGTPAGPVMFRLTAVDNFRADGPRVTSPSVTIYVGQ